VAFDSIGLRIAHEIHDELSEDDVEGALVKWKPLSLTDSHIDLDKTSLASGGERLGWIHG